MKRIVSAVIALILLATLSACGKPLVGTVTFKVHEPSRSYPESGYRTHYRTESYPSTCTRSSYDGKTTRTTTYSCMKSRQVSYRVWETWIEHVPECFRIGVEYIVDDDPNDVRNTTRCVPQHIWNTLTVGGHYDSSVNK